MDFALAQRGRALIDFEVGLRQTANDLQRALEQKLADRGVTAATLPDDMDARHDLIDATLDDWAPARTRSLYGEWCSKQHGRACEEAFEEIRDTAGPVLDALAAGRTTIEHAPGAAPAYWSDVWFHRTRGGWDASAYNGFVHGELVHRRYVAKIYPGDVYAQRRRVLDELADGAHRRILEWGSSSGHYTVALAERFPDAQIVGVDPSVRMLEQAQRIANANGHAWRLIVGVGEDSGLPDASFDLVTAYAIHHELPPKVITRWFEEAFRLLEPGGELLMVDVPRTGDLDRLTAWRFDWLAKWGGEPFWRSSAKIDLAAGACAAGFVEVRVGGIPPTGNPYYVYGRKPRDG